MCVGLRYFRKMCVYRCVYKVHVNRVFVYKVERLLYRGADHTVRNKLDRSVLDVACEYGHAAVSIYRVSLLVTTADIVLEMYTAFFTLFKHLQTVSYLCTVAPIA